MKNLKHIPEYDQKKEDLLDCYNYILDNTDFYDSADQFDSDDFLFDYKETSIDLIADEVRDLKPVFEENEGDRLRIEKIERSLSLDFPVYIFQGEIIAGVHRSIAYFNKNIHTIPVVIISKIP